MATITETSKPMDNTLDDVSIEFYLGSGGSLAARLRVNVHGRVDRDDGGTARLASMNSKINDSDVSTFVSGDSAALRTLLKKLYDAWRVENNVS